MKDSSKKTNLMVSAEASEVMAYKTALGFGEWISCMDSEEDSSIKLS